MASRKVWALVISASLLTGVVVSLAVVVLAGRDQTSAVREPNRSHAIDASAVTYADAYDAIAAIRLPLKRVDVNLVLWKLRNNVEQAIGVGEQRDDGKWVHELGGGAIAVLTYGKPHDRVVAIEIPTASSGYETMTDDQKDRVAEWFGLAKKQERVNGRQVWFGDAFSGVGLALYEFEYIKSLDDRLAKETAERFDSPELRNELAAEMGKAMIKKGQSVVFLAEGHQGRTLTIAAFGGTCDREVLLAVLAEPDIASALRKVGFRKVACSQPDNARPIEVTIK